MKRRIFNSNFYRAGYSFSNLSMYYSHMVAQLQYYADEIKEEGKEIEEAEKEKGREFNKRGQQKIEKLFAEIWPGYFHNSFLTSACSQFEHEIKKLCAIIQEEHNMPMAWDQIHAPVPARTKSYLNLAGVEIQDDPPDFKPWAMNDENRIVISVIWRELRYYYRVRNCIVHDNGLVEKAPGAKKLQKYATEKGILVKRNGQPEIRLNRDFNLAVCEMMQQFFERLLGAYYSTPLPE